jgi:hypothetical protein
LVRRRWIGVREDHTGEGEPANAIVAIDFDQPGTSPGRMRVGGQDFFCEQIGVKHIFGLIGDSLNPLADALPRSQIEWVGGRHEEGAALAALLAVMSLNHQVQVSCQCQDCIRRLANRPAVRTLAPVQIREAT